MSIRLSVSFVSQRVASDGSRLNDWTGCWYASACMLSYHFEAGPRVGLPALYGQQQQGAAQWTGHARISMSQVPQLMRNEGLTPVPGAANWAFGLREVEALLQERGPILFFWLKSQHGRTYGHASVIYGTMNDVGLVLYHDPENGPDRGMTAGALHRQRFKEVNGLLQRA